MRNAFFLLLYAWEMASYAERFDAVSTKSPSLMGLLARVLHDWTAPLVRRQLNRSFSTVSGEVEGVRGKLRLLQTARLTARHTTRAYCTYSHLTVDTAQNQILKATIQRLANDERIVHPNLPEETKALRRDLRALVRLMGDVSLIRPSSALFASLQSNRSDREYRLPLRICEMLHKDQLPSETTGPDLWRALEPGSTVFHRLFEKFTRNFLKAHFGEWVVGSKRMYWPTDVLHPHMPAMETDTTLVNRDTGELVIVENKFTANSLIRSRHGNRAIFDSSHLYQLYAYLRTQERTSSEHRTARGVLLYPKVEHDLDERFELDQHPIRIMTVDLDAPWQAIDARMRSIVNDR